MVLQSSCSRLWFTIWALALLCLLRPCQAKLQSAVQYCQGDEVQGIDSCIAVASTKHNETSPTNDLSLRISAAFPHRLGWAAFGTGDAMEGSLMFIIYPGKGENDITVSVRTTQVEHDAPKHESFLPRYDIKEISIIDQTYYEAVILCYECDGYNDGSKLDITATKQPWIWAAETKQQTQSADTNLPLTFHSGFGSFTLNMKAAMSNGPIQPDSPQLTINRVSSDVEQDYDIRHTMFKAHGMFLTVAFSFIMPIAAAIIRGQVESALTKHYSLQIFALPTVLFGIAIGMFFSTWRLSFDLRGAHKMIGVFLLFTTFVQPILGWIHHQKFKKLHERTTVSFWHIYLGRITMGLGWFNVVLGLYIGHVSLFVWFCWLVWTAAAVTMLINPSAVFGKIPFLQKEPTFEAEDREERYELVGNQEH